MEFIKPPLTISSQISLLEKRGMIINDRQKTEHYLSNISYYRLRAYMMPFQSENNPEHNFRKDTTFDDILNLYKFDRELRLLLFDSIERIEIALRSQIIYQFSLVHGSHWYELDGIYRNPDYFKNILEKLDEEINRSNEIFIKHYNGKYTSPIRPPAWMSFEVTTMGLLSKIFKNIKDTPEKKLITRHFQLGHSKVLESWMHSISYIRNICAHHSRLWNRKITIQPILPSVTFQPWQSKRTENNDSKLYNVLCCIFYLLRVVNPSTTFKEKLVSLINDYPSLEITRMGFHEDWQKEPLWS